MLDLLPIWFANTLSLRIHTPTLFVGSVLAMTTQKGLW
jgi:hypothetical protein